MPRQRKPQNGGQRIGTWRVANTTTAQPKLQTVYRIPAWGKYWECEKLAYEVVWTTPVQVHIEWENVYRISLDMNALQDAIEGMNLDLSNVTLHTVNWDVEFTGNITSDWTFTWTTVNATTLNATTWNIDTAVIWSLTSTTSSLGTAAASSVTTDTLIVNETSTFTWNVTASSDVSVAWTLTADTWDISTLTSTDATITNLSATNWSVTTLTSDSATLGQLSVTWTSSFTGDVTAGNITSSWNTTLNNLTTTGNTSLNWATVNGNLAISGNETVTWNVTVAGSSTFNGAVTMSDDLTVVDDLTVQWTTHLNDVETTGSVDIDWTLRVEWAINGWNWLVVDWQVESDSLVTGNAVVNNITINWNITLWNDATAPDFVLQDEKWAANWVCPLDANWMVDPQYLPPVYTTAIVKVGTGIFSNSDTSVVVDSDITSDSFVALSNYSDIVWDLNEVINVWQLTVVSNQTETGSYKYIIVNPLSQPIQNNQ